MYRLLIGGLLLAAITGCRTEWVQLTDAGEQVSVALPAEVTDCERVGNASVNSRDVIGFIPRSARELQNELVRLARNEAADIGGNRIVAESIIRDGRQSFGVYDCPGNGGN